MDKSGRCRPSPAACERDSEFNMTSAIERVLQPSDRKHIWPDDFVLPALCLRILAFANRPVQRAQAWFVGLAPCDRPFRAPLLAFIVVIEERASAQTILLQLSPSGLKPCSQISGQTRIDLSLMASSASRLCELTLSFVPGVLVEQRQRTL